MKYRQLLCSMFLCSLAFSGFLYSEAPKSCPTFDGLEMSKMLMGGSVNKKKNEWKFFKKRKFKNHNYYNPRPKAPLVMLKNDENKARQYLKNKAMLERKFEPYTRPGKRMTPEMGRRLILGKKRFYCAYPIWDPNNKAKPENEGFEFVEVTIGVE